MNHEFDNYAQTYREDLDKHLSLSGESSTYFAQYKAQKLQEWLNLPTNTTQAILDFGCGDGVMTNFVYQLLPKAQLYGVDPSSESIAIAQKKFTDISFSVSSTTIAFADQTFDTIFAAGVFHHIPFEHHTHYLQELFRVLKPGGSLVLFELNPLNPLTVYIFKNNPIDYNARLMTPWYTKKLVKDYGKTRLIFYCFFPSFLARLRIVEPYMTWAPFSALYAVIISKSSKKT